MGPGFLVSQPELLAAARELADVAADLDQLRGSLSSVPPPAAAWARLPQSQTVAEADVLCGSAIDHELRQDADRARTVGDGVTASAHGYTAADFATATGYQS